MTQKIYIGNLPHTTSEDEVRRLCEPFGPVISIAMIRDRQTRRFRGFCFVEMQDAHAAAAIAALNGKDVSGRKIKANKARSQGRGRKGGKKQRPSSDIPLHERTERGGLGAYDEGFPHSGGVRGRRHDDRNNRSDSDFPDSGGRTRR